ncbi:hypothetical protein CYMTET_8213 [Cymbomonas tetramitiformis]|uniref:Uncharacterized protein n=1 Tax=Cymbomonas tetramitiformis TaxID=36881 RepID=A0AAE0GU28_9CHLO|nr:hypothetical protein CYMTET_8213 [Cymbomonas tetramitiformis]
MAPKVNMEGSKPGGGPPLDEPQDMERKTAAAADESVQAQLVAAVQQLSEQTRTLYREGGGEEFCGKAKASAQIRQTTGATWDALTGAPVLKKLLGKGYVEYLSDVNPYPKCPKNLQAGAMHVQCSMHDSRTSDQLVKKPNSSLYYEYKTLAPMLPFTFGAKEFS